VCGGLGTDGGEELPKRLVLGGLDLPVESIESLFFPQSLVARHLERFFADRRIWRGRQRHVCSLDLRLDEHLLGRRTGFHSTKAWV
jgi:hypothetical protein